MLNEIKEYEQYASSPELFKSNTIQPRLKFNTLFPQGKATGNNRGRAGMARAMTIIARSFIFGKTDYKNEFRKDDGTFNDKEVLNILRAWCGLECKKKIDIFKQNWIKEYIRFAFFEKELKEAHKNRALLEIPINIVVEQYVKLKKYRELKEEFSDLNNKKRINKEKMQRLNNKLENFRNSMDFLAGVDIERYDEEADRKFSELENFIKKVIEGSDRLKKIVEFLINYEEDFNPDKPLFPKIQSQKTKTNNKNDLKTIKFKSIIANALNEGPLHRYYLICNANPMDRVRKNNSKTPIGKHAKCSADSDVRLNAQDRILKTTACYLLQQKINPDQEFVYFNRQDLINWLKTDNLKSNILPTYRFVTKDDENDTEPIFEFITISKNTSKLRVNPHWLETFNFKLIEEHDLDNPENREMTFYSDQGGGEYLHENQKYS